MLHQVFTLRYVQQKIPRARDTSPRIAGDNLLPADDPLQLLRVLGRVGEVHVARLRDDEVILDPDSVSLMPDGAETMQPNSPHATDVPVLVQHVLVDELGVHRVLQVWVDDEFAEVNLFPVSAPPVHTLQYRREYSPQAQP